MPIGEAEVAVLVDGTSTDEITQFILAARKVVGAADAQVERCEVPFAHTQVGEQREARIGRTAQAGHIVKDHMLLAELVIELQVEQRHVAVGLPFVEHQFAGGLAYPQSGHIVLSMRTEDGGQLMIHHLATTFPGKVHPYVKVVANGESQAQTGISAFEQLVMVPSEDTCCKQRLRHRHRRVVVVVLGMTSSMQFDHHGTFDRRKPAQGAFGEPGFTAHCPTHSLLHLKTLT